MEAHKKSLSLILSVDVRLVAPLFQRPYVWTRDANWLPLWLSLCDSFDRRLNELPSRPYFMGAIVLDNLQGSTGSVPSREIIDGQQRMITLQIFMECAKSLFVEHGLEYYAKQLHKLTRNDLEYESEEQFKVWPTNIDRDAFQSVMTGKEATGCLAGAREFFNSKLVDWLRSDESLMKQKASALVDTLKQDLVFVAIDLNDDDDGQLIFETLNSLGTPLLPSDLVKNLLFREALAQGLNTSELYANCWESFEVESEYWRKKISIGRREKPMLDVFLQYYMTLKLSREPVVAHQFREYRDAYREGIFGNTVAALHDFSRLAKLYKEFEQSRNGLAGSLRQVLDVLDISVPNPLILGFYTNVQCQLERGKMMQVVESYLMRRFLCGLTTKNYNRIFAEVITKLNSIGWSEDNLRKILLAYEGKSTEWPSDEWLISRQIQKDAYGSIRGLGIIFALSKVEGRMRSSKSETVWNTQIPLSIEHLMPQTWAEHWPLVDENDVEAFTRRKDCLDKIGNLTVLTRKLNSSLSNGPWDTKRKHLNDHTVLLINSALANQENWNEQLILNRCQELGQKFCQIWPR